MANAADVFVADFEVEEGFRGHDGGGGVLPDDFDVSGERL